MIISRIWLRWQFSSTLSSSHWSLLLISTSSYPASNCHAKSGQGVNVSAQDVFSDFLNHTSGVRLVDPYLNSAKIAVKAGLPLLMLETNSASCGGFPGVSDSFGGALWALDYSLQMAYSNFSGAYFHVNGQGSSYNVCVISRSPVDPLCLQYLYRPSLVCNRLSLSICQEVDDVVYSPLAIVRTIPTVDNWTNILCGFGHGRSTWFLQCIASSRPRCQQQQHLHSGLRNLRGWQRYQGGIVQLHNGPDRSQRLHS